MINVCRLLYSGSRHSFLLFYLLMLLQVYLFKDLEEKTSRLLFFCDLTHVSLAKNLN